MHRNKSLVPDIISKVLFTWPYGTCIAKAMFSHNQSIFNTNGGVQGQNRMVFQIPSNTAGNSLGNLLLGPDEKRNGDLLTFVKDHNATLNFPQKVDDDKE
eukprot:scaffold1525_cov142-Cylindrotheca_fusiformis.AAC.39